MKEVIRLDNVVKMYDNGIRAINGINLSVCEREYVVISGAPGSGKTTLARLIAGMDKPSAGQIFVLGKPVHEMKKDTAAAFRNKYISVLRRNTAFVNNLSVLENVALPLMLRGEGTVQRDRKAKEQLKALGLVFAAYAHPLQLTPLEKLKTAIARALITQPEILLLDDFAAELTETAHIKGILHALCRYGDHTLIELTGACQSLICADKVITLGHGKIQEERT